MVRKLLITLLSTLVLLPASALALGLGNITLHSALNEPLHAEIELLSIAPGELDSLRVGLADAETFTRLGVERDGQLMLLEFEVITNQANKPVVRISSRDNIREPFLSFLIDARWHAGRLVREFTLLLDPPVRHAEQATPPVSAPAVDRVATAAQPPVRASAPTAPMAASPQPSSGLVYGPVKEDDTLWGIARQMRPSSDISVQQMMMAFFQANPYAFIDGNINRLKAGYVLRIDDPALLRAMTQAEAAREVSRQTQAWQQARREAAARRAAERVAPAMDASVPAAGSAAVASVEPELKLVTPAEGKAEVAQGSELETETLAAVRQDLMLALESSAAQRQENEQLRKRIQAMEAQLADMERLLSLKSSDLAQLQQQLRAGEGQAEATTALVAPPQQQTATETTAGTAPQPAESAVPAQPTAETAAATPPPAQERPRRVVAPPPPPPPGMMEQFLADPMLMGIAGGVVLLLLILVLIMVRRRKQGSFQESILSGGSSSMLAAKASEDKETSFLSDLAISGMGAAGTAADEGEVDPLTEAEVFITYGRHLQAEEVLKKALQDSPQRMDLVAKLLEVYHSTRNTSEFEQLAQTHGEALRADQSLWARIAPLGRELLPDHPLFGDVESTEPAASTEEPSPLPSDDVLDIGLDLDELTAEMESEVPEDPLFDLDLGLSLLDEPDTGTDQPDGTENQSEATSPLDLELDDEALQGLESAPDEQQLPEPEMSLELSESTDTEAAAELGEMSLDETDELSLDLDIEDETLPAEETAAASSVEVAEPAADTAELSSEVELPEPAMDESEMDLASLDFGELDLAEETASDTADLALSDLDSELGELDLSDLDALDEEALPDEDDITTKLDLAQAYIEMGDAEGARGMLEDVLQAGNSEQQKQAQELLDKI